MLTQERIKELTNYNPETGEFVWSKKASVKVAGKPVGSLSRNGYLVTKVNYERYMVHRLIWLYVNGELPKGEIDHKNRIKTDNRISNLRDVERSVNLANCKRKTGKSGVAGVRLVCGGKWQAYIHIKKKFINLGSFVCKSDAIKARLDYERKMFGNLSRNG